MKRTFHHPLLWITMMGMIVLMTSSVTWAEEVGAKSRAQETADELPSAPDTKEKCPVCGMFVAKYPDWVGTVTFSDGTHVYFDGAKDLFKYFFALKRYAPDRNRADIRQIHVTEYYDLKPVSARDAFFVIGSDVYGPMGKELIPFTTREDAEAFMKDHGGTQILRFPDVTRAVIETLD